MKPITRVLAILTALVSISAHAETFASKEWAWSTDPPDFYYAATVNGAGHILGQYCYFEAASCPYLVGIGIDCEKGSQYPALINSDAGSAQVSLVCAYKYQNQFVLVINSFDDADRIIRAATRIGIAVPMQGDEFKVSRFGLAGSTYAIDLMRAAAQDNMERQPQNANTLPPEERI